MQKKDLHIVFGSSGETILSQSQIVNKDEGDILSLCDLVSLGPLSNLDDSTGIESRKSWFRKFLNPIEYDDGSNFVDNDFNLIKTLSGRVGNYKHVQLWFGSDASEKIATARLLYHLQGLTISIFKLNLSQVKFKTDKGVILDTSSLQQVAQADVPKLLNHFEELTEQDRQSYASLWQKLINDNGSIHLFDKKNNCISRDESFLDRYLMNRCTTQTKSAMVVGYVLIDLWEEWGLGEIGDIILYYRLNILEKEGKVKITERDEDPERGRRLFNVTRVS